MNSSKYTLSEVAAGAYPGRSIKATLVHAVDSNGRPACDAVKAEHLAEYAHPMHMAPTCKKCLKAWNQA